jgi:hypothetical protein
VLSSRVKIAAKPQAPDKAPDSGGGGGGGAGSSFNQLLGIKGAAKETVRTQCPYLFIFTKLQINL